MLIELPEEKADLLAFVPVFWAYEKGFRFLLTQDGDGEVLSPEGTLFRVSGFKCRCGKHLYRNYCLHALWIRQLRPCEQCGDVMVLHQHTTCFGETATLFQCPSCGNTRDVDLVREERKIGVKDHRMTPEGRCKQAIAWLLAKGSPWYIWQLVYHCPELIPQMVSALSEIDEHMLADQIVENAGFKAA
jgi:hypothetical protein